MRNILVKQKYNPFLSFDKAILIKCFFSHCPISFDGGSLCQAKEKEIKIIILFQFLSAY